MSDVKWTVDQKKAIEARNGSILVSAAAGSGKTAVLVERLIRRITEERLDITKFLIITYTKAAASELRRKISEALYAYAATHITDKHIRRQLALVGSARISTIHSFCTWALKNYSGNPELAEGFRVLDEAESVVITDSLVREIIDERYESGNERFMELAEFSSDGKNDRMLAPNIIELFNKSRTHAYPDKWLAEVSREYNTDGKSCITETIWGMRAFEKAKENIAFAVSATKEVLAHIEGDAELYDVYYTHFEELLSKLENMAEISEWNALYAAVSGFKTPNLPQSKKVTDKDSVQKIKDAKSEIKEAVLDLLKTVLPDTSEMLLGEIGALRPCVEELCSLVGELSDRYKAEKLRLRALDYSDLEHYTIELFVKECDEEKDVVVPNDTAIAVSKEFEEILLDEFQDSNSLQDMIFRAVSREEKNIVMVGDVKQSIYRFRLADPTIFMKKFKAFRDYNGEDDGEPRKIILSQNFRSRKEVLDASNGLFKRVMTEELGGIDYTEEQHLRARENIPEIESDMSCEFYLIDYDRSDDFKGAQCEARFIAEKIEELVSEGFLISQKDGTARPVTYGDFAILLRSASSKASIYEKELKKRNIPYISPREEGLLQKSEIEAIISFLSVIDNPTSDIPLLSVLKSPLFGFTSDDLCEIRLAGNGTLISAVESLAKEDSETAGKCREFAGLLSELRAFSRGASASDIVWEIYNRTNVLGLFGALPFGEERQRNLNEFYKSVCAFESTGYAGLYKLVSHIARLAENGGDIPAPCENSGEAVTIMTIHKSKGLEFPIVFFASSIRNFNTDDISKPILIHPKYGVGLNYRDEARNSNCSTIAREVIASSLREEMKSEEMRVYYVAMTRAREKLFITASYGNSANLIKKYADCGFYPSIKKRMLSKSGSTAPWFLIPIIESGNGTRLLNYADKSGPAQSDDSWIEAFPTAPMSENEDAEKSEIKQAELIFDDDLDEVKKLCGFTYPNSGATGIPSKITATGMSYAHSNAEAYTIKRKRTERPRFMQEKKLTPAERGTALHLAMQFCDFESCKTAEGAKKELLRLLDMKFLTKEQYSVIEAARLCHFINSDIGREMLSADKVYRETKFSVLVSASDVYGDESLSDEKLLLQGVMDLYYEKDGEITIVDFKTDRNIPEGDRLRQYSDQLRTYRTALFEMTGKMAKRLVLYLVSAGRELEIS